MNHVGIRREEHQYIKSPEAGAYLRTFRKPVVRVVRSIKMDTEES